MCILHCNPKVGETRNHFHCIFCHMFSYDCLSYKIMNLCTGSLNQGPKYCSSAALIQASSFFKNATQCYKAVDIQ